MSRGLGRIERAILALADGIIRDGRGSAQALTAAIHPTPGGPARVQYTATVRAMHSVARKFPDRFELTGGQGRTPLWLTLKPARSRRRTSAPASRPEPSPPKPSPAPPMRRLRWQVKEREATGTATNGTRYHVELDPSTHRFEVTHYADEDDGRGRLLPVDAGSVEGAIAIAEQHFTKRGRLAASNYVASSDIITEHFCESKTYPSNRKINDQRRAVSTMARQKTRPVAH